MNIVSENKTKRGGKKTYQNLANIKMKIKRRE